MWRRVKNNAAAVRVMQVVLRRGFRVCRREGLEACEVL
uniref:Uncharacterized protein n=1 Tax=Rhizophora mucronata TaxID=61149 RepID=A0A2P2J2C0_RHIMU